MPRVAAIHDLAGFSRTSLNAVIPILTTLGIQVCPMPTAILSSGTSGYEGFAFHDLTATMRDTLRHWHEIQLTADCVYSGFLGSPEQVEIVSECANVLLPSEGLFMVDPVMGDNGELEPTMGPAMVESMRWLSSRATCITPNLTEAALLLREPYPEAAMEQGLADSLIFEWLARLSGMGPQIVVITSVPLRSAFPKGAVMAYDSHSGKYWKVLCDHVPAMYPGTGDTFTSVLTGCLLKGDSLPVAMDRAVQFVTLAIRAAFGHDRPHKEGVSLERVLSTLLAPVTTLRYTLAHEDSGFSRL